MSNGLILSMNIEDIQKKINEYLPIRIEEKDKFGEVFTPVDLINELLDKLPSRVWKDPNLKWLDPANGIGNFPMIVYSRLMERLPGPKNAKKSNHILKNMIYMCELNPKNAIISRKIFGKDANIAVGDFFNKENWKKKFGGIDIFDVIIGNPPFQTEVKPLSGNANRSAGAGTLWDKFIIQSFELLKPNGILGFITPPGWRKPGSKLWNLMTQDNQLLYLHIYNKKRAQEIFHVSQRIDLYVIEKKPHYKNVELIDSQENKHDFNLKNWNFLPNYDYVEIKKILTTEEDGIKVIYNNAYNSQKASRIKSDKNKYPVIHGIIQKGLVLLYTDDKKKGHFGIPKVILNANEQQYPVNDFEGKYGMSQLSFGIPITSKKQGDDIVKAINSDRFKEIIKATKWGIFQTEYKMFKYFKPDFYKSFLSGKNTSVKIKHTKNLTRKKRKK